MNKKTKYTYNSKGNSLFSEGGFEFLRNVVHAHQHCKVLVSDQPLGVFDDFFDLLCHEFSLLILVSCAYDGDGNASWVVGKK